MAESKAEKGRDVVQRLWGASAGGGGGTPMPADFARYSTEHLFGDVWQGKDLELEERSLTTCTVLTALGREAEQRTHFTGAKNLGIPRAKLEAMITHSTLPAERFSTRNWNPERPEAAAYSSSNLKE